jgi:carboxymethylenebutenolidase
MAETIHLTAADGFELSAYQATPNGAVKGAVVVIQEIFGVNGHIREVVDGYASEGYLAVAPALFDRVEPGIELGYEGDDMTQGVQLAFEKLQMPQTLSDVQAAIQHAGTHGKVGVVGYCFGGLLTWLSACQLSGVSAASAYYGGGVAGQMAMSPSCPTIMHFGDKDAHIPMSDVEQVKTAQPDVSVYVYSADHGFNCDHRASYDAASAATARERTLDHFKLHLA